MLDWGCQVDRSHFLAEVGTDRFACGLAWWREKDHRWSRHKGRRTRRPNRRGLLHILRIPEESLPQRYSLLGPSTIPQDIPILDASNLAVTSSSLTCTALASRTVMTVPAGSVTSLGPNKLLICWKERLKPRHSCWSSRSRWRPTELGIMKRTSPDADAQIPPTTES
jgi:hypothetical protein